MSNNCANIFQTCKTHASQRTSFTSSTSLGLCSVMFLMALWFLHVGNQEDRMEDRQRVKRPRHVWSSCWVSTCFGYGCGSVSGVGKCCERVSQVWDLGSWFPQCQTVRGQCLHACIPVFPTSQNSLTAKVSASTGAGGGMLSSHNHFSKVNFDISNKVQQTRTWLSVHMVALTCSTASLDLLTTTIGPTSAASPFALQRNAIKIHLTTWTGERISSSLVCIRLISFVGLSLCPVPDSRAWPAFNAAKAFSAAVLEICEWQQYSNTCCPPATPEVPLACCGKRKASLNRMTSSATLCSSQESAKRTKQGKMQRLSS